MTEEKKNAGKGEDDKSINELLNEYADDVKDKDLDDFLKGSDDDAFESDNDDSGDDDTETAATAPQQPKKSGGMLSALALILVFGAAGAGAYMYMHRGDGMTNIMGGFAGGESAGMGVGMEAPPAPEAATALPMPESTAGEASLVAPQPAQPAAIMNADGTMPPMPGTSAPEPQITEVFSEMPATTEATAPAGAIALTDASATPATPADASNAVEAWTSGTEMPAANTGAKLPEQAVGELKAKPPVTTKSAKPAKLAEVKSAEPPVMDMSAEAMPTDPQPKKAKPRAQSAEDGALPPPYVAIQAGKGGTVAPAKTDAAPKMAPVVEGSKSKAAPSERNINEADKTSVTGDFARMIEAGGGMIEVRSKQDAVPAPVGMKQPAPKAAAPKQRMIPLAINGGASLPPEQMDAAMKASAPVKAKQPVPAEPKVKAVPVERVEKSAPVAKTAPAPKLDTEEAISSTMGQNAKAVLAQAIAAEKAGKAGDALELYQRALEIDAVYAEGKSIDRGMVYDRIGAIRASGQ